MNCKNASQQRRFARNGGSLKKAIVKSVDRDRIQCRTGRRRRGGRRSRSKPAGERRSPGSQPVPGKRRLRKYAPPRPRINLPGGAWSPWVSIGPAALENGQYPCKLNCSRCQREIKTYGKPVLGGLAVLRAPARNAPVPGISSADEFRADTSRSPSNREGDEWTTTRNPG